MGQIGWNDPQVFESQYFIGKMRQTLLNIRDVVEAAGGSVTDIVRLTWFVTGKAECQAHQITSGHLKDVM